MCWVCGGAFASDGRAVRPWLRRLQATRVDVMPALKERERASRVRGILSGASA